MNGSTTDPKARHGTRPGRARLRIVAVTVTVVLLGAGCTAARNDLGTTTEQCFRAIPVGRAAVHGSGTYAGTVLVTVRDLTARGQLRLSTSRDPRAKALCLVAYHGSYHTSDVMRPTGTVPSSGVGSYAVAIVSSPGNFLLGTNIFQMLPKRFRHTHVG
jgi:hypothetical protein